MSCWFLPQFKILTYSGFCHFLQAPADRPSERNKSSDDVFETLRKKTALRGENVKYISSSRLFTGPLLDNVFTQGGEP